MFDIDASLLAEADHDINALNESAKKFFEDHVSAQMLKKSLDQYKAAADAHRNAVLDLGEEKKQTSLSAARLDKALGLALRHYSVLRVHAITFTQPADFDTLSDDELDERLKRYNEIFGMNRTQLSREGRRIRAVYLQNIRELIGFDPEVTQNVSTDGFFKAIETVRDALKTYDTETGEDESAQALVLETRDRLIQMARNHKLAVTLAMRWAGDTADLGQYVLSADASYVANKKRKKRTESATQSAGD